MNIIKKTLIIFALLITFINYSNAYTFSSNVFSFQKKLASKGNSEAQYKLGTMYETGTGVKADINKALIWYKKSADQQNENAKNRITYIDILQNGYDKKKHFTWLNNLISNANKRNGEAAFLLGNIYKNGMGVEKSLNKARKYLTIANKLYISGSYEELSSINLLIKKRNHNLKKIKSKKLAQIKKTEAEKTRKKLIIQNNKLAQEKITQKKIAQKKLIQKKPLIEPIKKRKKETALTQHKSKTLKKEKTLKDKENIITEKNKDVSWSEAIMNKKTKSNKSTNDQQKPINILIKKNSGISWGEAVRQKSN